MPVIDGVNVPAVRYLCLRNDRVEAYAHNTDMPRRTFSTLRGQKEAWVKAVRHVHGHFGFILQGGKRKSVRKSACSIHGQVGLDLGENSQYFTTQVAWPEKGKYTIVLRYGGRQYKSITIHGSTGKPSCPKVLGALEILRPLRQSVVEQSLIAQCLDSDLVVPWESVPVYENSMERVVAYVRSCFE